MELAVVVLVLLLGAALLRELLEGVTMAACDACQKSISKKATICPYCHTKTRRAYQR